MPRKSTRAPEPAALVELLWNPSTAVGRSGLTIEALTSAAVQIADVDGLEAVTMRRVADAAGVGAMTLYSYVPGRPELIELMADRAASEVYAGVDSPATQGNWRNGIEYVAWTNWRYLLAHPWVTDVPPTRPVLGPGVTGKYELELAPLDGIGLGDIEMDQLLSNTLGLVLSAARWQLGLDRARSESGLSDEQWWQVMQPAIDAQIAARQFPIASRVGETVSSAGEPEAGLRRGLAWLLDGVDAG
ncbi:TetR family transcriptional regulator [Epidermidibacterium keratini]|uniref:TetR family transcriptional regulator n=1 Tax=Epidermidibacterium keratini TaxID=1891644 RepID=A0A7L4YNR0_9ACTN|nr:TetR/AcrR family transcriptional regulator [Epidermidibacterium keratini]QHC00533.1 TetR family transcriptional regulator [Epidermidibacterium keratini]